ncbi:MAG TPA: DUF4010 domain-containing protein [Alphaproteobacteria bacterium]
MGDTEALQRMAVALAVGLVIGLERGWADRNAPEGSRVAGLRTFALIGFAGGLVAVIGSELDALVAGAIALALGGLLLVVRHAQSDGADVGLTTEVACVVTFALGTVAGLGHAVPAIAGAVASAFLLGLKPTLHRWLRGIDQRELFAALQLVLISAVVLPLLPDKGYGPHAALNPYRLWWMVVLVAGLSFAGYVAARVLGARAGALLTGLCGGLASSTATTVALARRARTLDRAHHPALAAGIGAACATMIVRVAVLVAAIDPPLLAALAPPLAAMLVAGAAATVVLWRSGRAAPRLAPDSAPSNPLDLRTALGFAALLAIVTLLVEAGRTAYGAAGLYVLAGASALVDVDAITVSIAQLGAAGLARDTAVTSLVIAAVLNTAVKASLAAALGPRTLAVPAAAALAAMVAAGIAAQAIAR